MYLIFKVLAFAFMSTQGSLSTGDLFSLTFPWPSNHCTGYMNFDLIIFAVFNKQYNFKSNKPNNLILIGGFLNLNFINCLSYPRRYIERYKRYSTNSL